MERLRHLDRLLAGHGIHDQQRLRWHDRSGDAHQLIHHRVVDVEPAGGVQDHHVEAPLLRDVEARSGDLECRCADRPRVDLDADLVAQLHELVDRGRPIDVSRDEEWLLASLAEPNGQLRGRGRLPGTLQADHHHDGWAGVEPQLVPLPAQHRDQLVVDDLHDLLPGVQAAQQVGADGAFADVRHEVLDHAEVDIRLEQRKADLPEGDVEVGLGDSRLAAKTLGDALQARREGFEHEATDAGVRAGAGRPANGCPF